MIVVVIIGVLALLVAPRIEPVMASRSVSAAKAGFSTLYSRARMAAVQTRRPATLTVDQNTASAIITLANGTTQNVGMAIRFDSTYGVTATASPSTVNIQPTGLVTGGLPFTLVLVRSSAADTVRITGYGRIE
jgi:type II secretory pathway pseudopilin PulG